MKTVIEMAREAGFAIDVSTDPNSPPSWWGAGHDDRFKALAELVRANEREASARVCEAEARMHEHLDHNGRSRHVDDAAVASTCAAAIRARSNT